MQFLFVWLMFGYYVQFFCIDYFQVMILNQQIVVYVFEIEVWNMFVLLIVGQNVYVLFGGGDFQGFFVGGWCNNYFDKLMRNDGLCGFCIQFVVKGNDVVECGGWVGFVCVIVSIKNGIVDSYVVRVGVFYNYICWFGEFFYVFQCCIGIGDVVIREGFILNLGCGSNGGFFYIFFYIEGSLLVVVFVVMYIQFFNEVQVQCVWEVIGGFFVFIVVSWNYVVEVVGNYVVVGGSVFEGFDGEVEMGCKRQRFFVVIYFFNNGVIVVVFYYDCDIFMVFGGGVYYCWVVDIDVFNCIFQ